jgi:hypothetical protein
MAFGVSAFSITHLHNAGNCIVERMVPATTRRCFQKTDLDSFSFGVSDFLRECWANARHEVNKMGTVVHCRCHLQGLKKWSEAAF